MAVADALSRAIESIDISQFCNTNDSWYTSLVSKVSECQQNHPSYMVEQGVCAKIVQKNEIELVLSLNLK